MLEPRQHPADLVLVNPPSSPHPPNPLLNPRHQAIKDHVWFQNLDWRYIADKVYMPPYMPAISSSDDASLFDKFDNLPPMESAAGLAAAQQAWFQPFGPVSS